MSKRTMIIAGVVAAALVVVFAAAILAKPGSTTTQGPGTSAAPSAGAPGAKPTPVSENASGGATGSQGTSKGAGTKSAVTTPKTGAKTSTSSGVSRVALKGFKPVPKPKVPEKPAPANPVTAVGEELAELTTQPGDTISGLAFAAVPEGSQYKVTMSPYGFGPSNVLGSRLVMKVSAVTPVGSAPKDSRISGGIVLALMDTGNGGGVTKGGTYHATVTFISDGTKLLPVLSKATAAK